MTQALPRDSLELPRALKITVEQYEHLWRTGLLEVGTRTELINGVIVAMPPMGDSHVNSINSLLVRLALAFHARAIVSSQTPVRLPPYGEPEPDFMLCTLESSGVARAEDVLLVIEISHSTYRTDRDEKLPMYAEHGIRDVWIVNLNSGQLEVYRNPRKVAPAGWVYDEPTVYKPGQRAAPLSFPDDLLEWW
jgi:Uma2 family endonuclease